MFDGDSDFSRDGLLDRKAGTSAKLALRKPLYSNAGIFSPEMATLGSTVQSRSA